MSFIWHIEKEKKLPGDCEKCRIACRMWNLSDIRASSKLTIQGNLISFRIWLTYGMRSIMRERSPSKLSTIRVIAKNFIKCEMATLNFFNAKWIWQWKNINSVKRKTISAVQMATYNKSKKTISCFMCGTRTNCNAIDSGFSWTIDSPKYTLIGFLFLKHSRRSL